jgi:DNA-binding response OmpR family regulator
MNILLIEDNQQFAEHLSATLLKNTYVNRVERVSSFAGFQELIGHLRPFDIALVDLVLEGDTIRHPSGFKVIETLRRNWNTMPIIVISSSDTIADIEYAFSLGATDYMGKDIRYKELEVRLFHWYREYCMSSKNKKRWALSYYGLEFAQSRNEYLYKGKIIEFTKTMKYLFSLFFNERWELLTDEYIIEKVWWYHEHLDMKNTLRVNIKRLRLILWEYGISHWLKTDWGEWYIFSYSEPDEASEEKTSE